MLKPYPAYKPSEVEWLGDVPEHWEVVPLRWSASCHSGDSLSFDKVREDRSDEYSVPVIGGNGLMAYTTTSSVTADVLVIGRVGALCGNVHLVSSPAWITDNALVLIPDSRYFTVHFLQFALRSRSLNDIASKTAQPLITGTQVADQRMPCPSSSEQFAITNYLGTETARIDNLIHRQQRLIELLQEKRVAVITNAIIRGLNPDAPMKRSGVEWLGDVPEHWTVISLGRLFRQTSDAGESTLPILSVSIHYGVSNGQLSEDEQERRVTRSEEKELYKRVKPNDLVYNMMRAWQGGFGTVSVVGQISPAYVVARPTQELRTQFIEHLLRTPPAIETVRGYSRGVTDFRLRLYWEEFKSLKVALPGVEEQAAILKHIAIYQNKADALIEQAERSITLMQERRSALISAAVTGKIDVRKAA